SGACWRFAFALSGDLGGLGEQRGVFLPEDLGAKPDSGINLRLPEWHVARTGAAQPIEQSLSSGVEILLELVQAPRRHLADGKLPGIVPAGSDQPDQRLGIGDVAQVERRAGRNVAGWAWPQQTSHPPRRRFDLGSQRVGDLGANGG